MINNNICRTTMIDDKNTQLPCYESPDGIKYLQKSEKRAWFQTTRRFNVAKRFS